MIENIRKMIEVNDIFASTTRGELVRKKVRRLLIRNLYSQNHFLKTQSSIFRTKSINSKIATERVKASLEEEKSYTSLLRNEIDVLLLKISTSETEFHLEKRKVFELENLLNESLEQIRSLTANCNALQASMESLSAENLQLFEANKVAQDYLSKASSLETIDNSDLLNLIDSSFKKLKKNEDACQKAIQKYAQFGCRLGRTGRPEDANVQILLKKLKESREMNFAMDRQIGELRELLAMNNSSSRMLNLKNHSEKHKTVQQEVQVVQEIRSELSQKLGEDLSRLSGENIKLKEQIFSLQLENNELKNHLSFMEQAAKLEASQREKLKAKPTEVERTPAPQLNVSFIVNQPREQDKFSKEMFDNYSKIFAEKDQQIEELKTENFRLNIENKDLVAKFEESELLKNRLEEEDFATFFDISPVAVEILYRKNKKLEAELEEASKQLNTLSQDKTKLEQNLDYQSKKLKAEAQASLTFQTATLKSQVERLQTELVKTREQLDELMASTAKSSAQKVDDFFNLQKLLADFAIAEEREKQKDIEIAELAKFKQTAQTKFLSAKKRLLKQLKSYSLIVKKLRDRLVDENSNDQGIEINPMLSTTSAILKRTVDRKFELDEINKEIKLSVDRLISEAKEEQKQTSSSRSLKSNKVSSKSKKTKKTKKTLFKKLEALKKREGVESGEVEEITRLLERIIG